VVHIYNFSEDLSHEGRRKVCFEYFLFSKQAHAEIDEERQAEERARQQELKEEQHEKERKKREKERRERETQKNKSRRH
jgi:competence protein ComGF